MKSEGLSWLGQRRMYQKKTPKFAKSGGLGLDGDPFRSWDIFNQTIDQADGATSSLIKSTNWTMITSFLLWIKVRLADLSGEQEEYHRAVKCIHRSSLYYMKRQSYWCVLEQDFLLGLKKIYNSNIIHSYIVITTKRLLQKTTHTPLQGLKPCYPDHSPLPAA